MARLRQRMLEDLRIRNLSPRTQQCYVWHVERFARHFGKSPALLGPEHIRQYQVHVVEQKNASWSWFNQAVCALRFVYGVTLDKDWVIKHIPYAKRDKKLPVVLGVEEVRRLLAAVPNMKHRTVLMTIYAGGLRLAEGVGLKVSDVDSEGMAIAQRQLNLCIPLPHREMLPASSSGMLPTETADPAGAPRGNEESRDRAAEASWMTSRCGGPTSCSGWCS